MKGLIFIKRALIFSFLLTHSIFVFAQNAIIVDELKSSSFVTRI